ncbi:MAG TPA: serine hydrolase domain-containing protein [Pyrinomonadaceae bacterium]|nr:serine hydrolase domain-containing protein [Pyrinomonadaceae bacterium]
MKLNILKLLFTAIFCVSNLFGQTVSEKLDNYFTTTLNPINGNILVAENGKAIYKKSFGYADFKNKIPNSETSRFNIASISKTFNAVAILQLKEKGKINIDDAVKKYLPEFRYADITIRHLLSHTSGLPDFDLYDELYEKEPLRIITNKDVMPFLDKWKEPLPFKPGEKWAYSNTNYNLLVLVVEKVSGQEFNSYLQENIFAKAKMSDTYTLEDFPHRRKDANRVVNHQLVRFYAETPVDIDNKIYPVFNQVSYRLSGLKGDGDIVTTTDDLLKYDQSLYSGILLKQATLDEAFTPTKLNNGELAETFMNLGKNYYGLGWFIFDDVSKGKIVWHTGGIPGSLSIFLRNISKNQTVILLDNAFSNGVYKNGVNAMHILNKTTPLLVAKRSIAREYGRTLVTKGVDSAFSKLIELQADTTNYNLDEDEMNQMGYDLFADTEIVGHQEKALEVLKLNALLFPKSWNVYDSYGEHLAKIGKKDEAIFMYRKSLELNPDSETGKKALEELLKK